MSENNASSNHSLKIVIFVGGSGTRMWPMSRLNSPKQFAKLIGDKTTFQRMIGYWLSAYSPDDIFISTSQKYVTTILEQAPVLKPDHIIAEPELRDTTAAIGFAAIHIAQRFPNSTMATVWGDHLIANPKAFTDAFTLAHKIAEEQNVTVQINVKPTFASPDLGYVQTGVPIFTKYGDNIYSFIRQVEKPDIASAKKFISSVHYLWHIGYRVWSVNSLLALYKKYIPNDYQTLMTIKAAIGTDQETAVANEQYRKIAKRSIDYAIYEHLEPSDQAVIAADLGWVDIGTWEVLKDELSDNPVDNVTKEQTILYDTSDSLVYGQPGKVTAIIGLEGMIVVDTPDALLVMPKDRSKDVKKVVEQLKQDGLDRYL